MACDGQITPEDLTNAKDDTTTLAEIVTSREGGISTGDLIFSTTDRFGNSHLTSEGALARIQANPINGGVWSAGVTFAAYNDYMIYNGVAYKPIQTTVLPYVSEATPNVASVEPFTLADNTVSSINVFDLSTTYADKDLVTDDIDGLIYKATTTVIDVQPSTDMTGSWVGGAEGIAISAVEGDTLVSTAIDNRLIIQSNLSDLDDVPTARTNLDVYSKSEVDNKSIKAYLNFNGAGAIKIEQSLNIASLTDDGLGEYSATFTVPMDFDRFLTIGSATLTVSLLVGSVTFPVKLTTSFDIVTRLILDTSTSLYDFDDVSIIVLGPGGV